MGWENVFQVENDKFCISRLEKNFPNVKRYGDIKEFDGTKYRGLINILTGGFPCQPFSVAGKQKGKGDDRHLWPEMLRVIREIQPPWIVGENVPGIIKLALEDICVTLESEGYAVQPFIIPSASIGAWDKRDRAWIIAHNNKRSRSEHGLQTGGQVFEGGNIKVNPDLKSAISEQSGNTRAGGNGCTNGISDTNNTGLTCITSNIECGGRENRLHGGESKRQTGERCNSYKKSDWWERNWIEVASELCGSNARVPHRMDRIKSLGNSVNPYVVFEIFKMIQEIESLQNKDL